MSKTDLISIERIEKAIYVIRGEKVTLDRDLAGQLIDRAGKVVQYSAVVITHCEGAMSTDRLNRIIEEVKSLTPDDRRRLLESLEHDEELSTTKMPVRRPGTLKGTVKYMAPDFDAPLDDFKEYME
jgi:hypothetical protein